MLRSDLMSAAIELETIKLSRKDGSGRMQEAIFVPEFGMNLISYKCNSYEVMDDETVDLFAERFAGLGAVIGPHFHRRPDSEIPPLPKDGLFPHIERVLAKGVKDPFSHGIARYVPWKYSHKGNRIFACIDGSDTYDGVALKDLEGQDFRMTMEADLTDRGLALRLKVSSEKPSVCGLHYYYRIPEDAGDFSISSINLKKEYRSPDGQMLPLPKEWIESVRDEDANEKEMIRIPVEGSMDHTFYTDKDFSYMSICNHDYILCIAQEKSLSNSWQIFHPENSSYVCVEPISSIDPRNPTSTESEVSVLLNLGAVPEYQEEGDESTSENG